MILAFILRAWAGFLSLPRGFHYMLAGALAVLALWLWHRDSVRDAVEADRDAQATAVASTAAVASQAATGAATAARDAGMARNEHAAAVASESADPLRDGLRELGR
jgi:heme A synthase